MTTKTLSRWVSELLTASDIDTNIFKPHSTRAAAGNYLKKSLSSYELCKLADWSTTSGVYEKFYLQYLWKFLLYPGYLTACNKLLILFELF